MSETPMHAVLSTMRDEAELFRRRGAKQAAATTESYANDLEKALESWWGDPQLLDGMARTLGCDRSLLNWANERANMSPFRRDAHRCPEGRVVYFLFRGHKVVYVGQSSSVFGRIGQHRRDGKEFDSWAYIEVDDEEAYRVEFRFIGRLKPEYNNRGV